MFSLSLTGTDEAVLIGTDVVALVCSTDIQHWWALMGSTDQEALAGSTDGYKVPSLMGIPGGHGWASLVAIPGGRGDALIISADPSVRRAANWLSSTRVCLM